MPVYNGAAIIRAALDSLLAQTFQNFVLIVSDNNSSDSTEEISGIREPRFAHPLRSPAEEFKPGQQFPLCPI
jgi:GT2 family glycosyltransferase